LKEFAKTQKLKYVLTSAKEDKNVDKCFTMIAQELILQSFYLKTK
jgi:hypothetical protein